MKTKDIVFNYLLENSNRNGEIKITNSTIAYLLNIPTRTVVYSLNLLRDEQKLIKRGKTVNILNKEQHIINNITNGLNYSNREKTLLLYIYKCYLKRNMNYDYICISRKNIYDNTTIENDKHITEYIQKFINDNLIEVIQGDWTKNKSNKYKVLFDNINTSNNINIDINNDNDNLVPITTAEFDKLNSRIDKMAILFKDIIEENKQLKQRVEYLESCLMNPVETKNNVSEEIIHTDGITYNPYVLFEEETTEIKDVVVNYSEEEIKAKQEEKDSFINYIHVNKEKLFQNIENIDLGITGDKKKMLDRLIENGNKMNSCIEIIQECININNLLYVLPKINNNVFTQAVQYYSTDTEKIKELKQYA